MENQELEHFRTVINLINKASNIYHQKIVIENNLEFDEIDQNLARILDDLKRAILDDEGR